MKNNNLTIGILGGFVLGSYLGILFTQEKREIAKNKIVDNSNNLKKMVKHSTNILNDTISEKINSLKNQSQQLKENAIVLIEQEKTKLENIKDINKSVFL